MSTEYEIPNFTKEELELNGKILKGAEQQIKAQEKQLKQSGKMKEMSEEDRKDMEKHEKLLYSLREKLTNAEEASTIETGG